MNAYCLIRMAKYTEDPFKDPPLIPPPMTPEEKWDDALEEAFNTGRFHPSIAYRDEDDRIWFYYH